MTIIKLRHGTAAQWTSANPILAEGEPGSESDTGKIKIGDGTSTWSNLEYFLPESLLRTLFTSKTTAETIVAAWDFTTAPTVDGEPFGGNVDSVNGMTGTVVLLNNVDNTSDANKPVSTAQQTALDNKVAKAGDTMTGRLNLKSYRESIVTNAAATGTVTLDLSVANIFVLTTTGAVTIALSNATVANTYGSITIRVTNGGTHAITWPAGTKFPDATAPVLTGNTWLSGVIDAAGVLHIGLSWKGVA